MSELSGVAKAIQAAQKEKITLNHKADFYPELSEQFAFEKSKLDRLLITRTSTLIHLEAAVIEKQSKAFTSLESPEVDDPTELITSSVAAVNRIVAEHNNRTAEFDKKRLEALTKLEKHYAALFIHEEKYHELLKQITDLKSTVTGQIKKLGELAGEIRVLEQAVSEAAKGAERINELLAAYFGKDDLRVMVSAEKRFQIVRRDVVAKNLSEGEKTAIAFAYFITRVQDGRHPLADTRVLIDDPISSLDSNHLFNTYALIKTQLVACRQLFISTHSFEFYNLIRDWMSDDKEDTKKPQSEWKKWGIYYIKRADDGKSFLEEIPKELLRFKSEYHYLFSTLYHFDKTGAADFGCLLSLPNIVRRFMEAFGGIMIPRWAGLHGKMSRLFKDEIERERVWKFINHYSHNTTITRSLTIPDTSECKAVVQACLKAVRDWNAEYFTDLEAEVSI
jgi:wobble nucleotide-excising tRNase